ncbi:4-alpha-glucanotransferase dpe2 [Sarracenia purpurea var. burkii]
MGVHVTLESLLQDKELNTIIKDLIRGSGRSYPHVEEDEKGIASIKQQVTTGQEKISSAPHHLNGIPKKETVAVL